MNSKLPDYYALLGVCYWSSKSDVSKAYHKMISACFSGQTDDTQINCYKSLEDAYNAICTAFNTLRYNDTRKAYDAALAQQKRSALEAVEQIQLRHELKSLRRLDVDYEIEFLAWLSSLGAAYDRSWRRVLIDGGVPTVPEKEPYALLAELEKVGAVDLQLDYASRARDMTWHLSEERKQAVRNWQLEKIGRNTSSLKLTSSAHAPDSSAQRRKYQTDPTVLIYGKVLSVQEVRHGKLLVICNAGTEALPCIKVARPDRLNLSQYEVWNLQQLLRRPQTPIQRTKDDLLRAKLSEVAIDQDENDAFLALCWQDDSEPEWIEQGRLVRMFGAGGRAWVEAWRARLALRGEIAEAALDACLYRFINPDTLQRFTEDEFCHRPWLDVRDLPQKLWPEKEEDVLQLGSIIIE